MMWYIEALLRLVECGSQLRAVDKEQFKSAIFMLKIILDIKKSSYFTIIELRIRKKEQVGGMML